jgi:NAD-dependent deacetylase
MDKVEILRKLIDKSEHLVFFGGAGVSTASNIPDFRSANGIYSEKYGNIPIETIISHSFFMKHPDIFYKVYKEKLCFPDALPNDCHKVLSKLEEMGILKAIITQNIDDLHQKAGSKNVIELHGSVFRNTA